MASSSINSSKSAWDKPRPARERVLTPAFYRRDTLRVARELLGKVLAVPASARAGAQLLKGRIVETEAYHGDDPASHSCRGETPRARVMFGEPGRAYVYFIYGNYEMLNFVTEPKGQPGAVLIRALEPIEGDAVMKRRRPGHARAQWTNGPGKLCRAMGILRAHNTRALQGPELFVLDDGFRYDDQEIVASPRVGITQALDRFWRFYVRDNAYVSRAPQNREARAYLEVPHRIAGGTR